MLARTISMPPQWRWPLRGAGAILALALIAAVVAWSSGQRALVAPPVVPVPAAGHLAAAAAQQGQPTTAADALRDIDHDLGIAQARAVASTNAWGDRAGVARLLLARARLTGSFDDYLAAGRAFDAAFAIATPGTGPHLERAGWNFAIHRLGAMTPDLDAVDRYVVPDDGIVAAALGLRGDVLFYRGQYASARAMYDRAEARMPTLGGAMKLANLYARTGDPERALRLLDEADAKIGGPQQQLRAYIELRRGVIELGRGHWDDAERRFRRADDIFPGYWPVEEQLATVRALKGAPDEAMAIFKRMAARDGQPDALDGIAGLYRARGDFANAQRWAAQAQAAWDRRLAQLPEAALGHTLDHLLAFGDPVRALAVARRNFAFRPYGDSATGLAWAYLANHRPREALAVVRPALAAGWVSAESHIVASEAHALLGEGKEADAERAAALAINPHSLDRNPGMTWLEQ